MGRKTKDPYCPTCGQYLQAPDEPKDDVSLIDRLRQAFVEGLKLQPGIILDAQFRPSFDRAAQRLAEIAVTAIAQTHSSDAPVEKCAHQINKNYVCLICSKQGQQGEIPVVERMRELANEARGHLLERPCNKTKCNIKLLRLIQLGATKQDIIEAVTCDAAFEKWKKSIPAGQGYNAHEAWQAAWNLRTTEPVATGEIPVVGDDYLVNLLEQTAFAQGDGSLTPMQRALEAIRPYLRTTEPVSDNDMAEGVLKLTKTLRYIQGIVERGENRKLGDDECVDIAILNYVKRLEDTESIQQEFYKRGWKEAQEHYNKPVSIRDCAAAYNVGAEKSRFREHRGWHADGIKAVLETLGLPYVD